MRKHRLRSKNGCPIFNSKTNMQRIFKIQDNILLGLSVLATDIQTFSFEMLRKVELYRIRENVDLTPQLFINLVSSILYEHRFSPFFLNPIVVGLDIKDNYQPYVACYNSIGSITQSWEFQVVGISSEILYGACEAFFKPKMVSDNYLKLVHNDFFLELIKIISLVGEQLYIYSCLVK